MIQSKEVSLARSHHDQPPFPNRRIYPLQSANPSTQSIRQVIYLDYHATTPVDPRVGDRILHTLTTDFGNANSIDHTWGDRAETLVKQATHHLATLINTDPRTIIWTSGATESINLAIQGTLCSPLSRSGRGAGGEGCSGGGARGESIRVAITAVEHKAVLDTCHALQQQGHIDLIEIPVDAQAQIDLNQIEPLCASGLHLLCVMAANNEVGTLYPIEKIAQIAQRYHVPFLCDATQAVGKIPVNIQDWGITMLALSAHKLYGPKGVGALIVQRDHHLEPLLYGGGHQRGLRSGTLNVPGIVGLGEACRWRSLEMEADERRIGELRDRLQHHLTTQIPNLVVNGDRNHRLAGNLHISIPGIPNSAVIARVRHQLAISTGSACSSGVETPSHVLRTMGLPDDQIESALRMGLGKFTTEAEVEQAVDILVQEIRAVQAIMDETFPTC
ncbi:MAG: cysteine desulfurase family protein [Leptolyngbyaceae cyanobacterium]